MKKSKVAAKAAAVAKPAAAAKLAAEPTVAVKKKSAARKPAAGKPAAPTTALALKGPPPAPTPIIAISVEGGVLVALFTSMDTPEPTEIRLASEKPFPQVIAAPARKCHQASAVFRDEKAGVERRATVAFIPTPKGARPDGAVHYRAKREKNENYFNVPTQLLESMDRDQLTKLLYVLNTPFKTVVGAALLPAHPLATEIARLEKLRASADAWNKVQAQVRERLEAKDLAGAFSLLEPLVFSRTPLPAAEKLLGEMLRKASAKRDDTAAETEEPSPAVEALSTARLLLEYALARAQLAG